MEKVHQPSKRHATQAKSQLDCRGSSREARDGVSSAARAKTVGYDVESRMGLNDPTLGEFSHVLLARSHTGQ